MEKLKTTFNIFTFYDEVKASGKKIAWCSAFAPTEVLMAMDIIPVYPENHAAMLGALSPDRNPDNPYSQDPIKLSEKNGLSSPKLCKYALSDIGILLGDATSPINGLPAPDMFYACNSQCSVVERWGDIVQEIFLEQKKEVPHYVLRAPSLTRKEEHSPEELQNFKNQIEKHIQEICDHFGLSYSEEKLNEIVEESDNSNQLWQKCLELAKRKPTPWTNIDAFTAMAPIVIARGTKTCTEYYRSLLAELEERVEKGIQAVPDEKIRLVWDAIPIWPRKNWLAKYCEENNIAFVASTYTHSWWFNFDAKHSMDSLVRRYAWNTMNRSKDWILNWTIDMVKEYQADGIVAHWNNSCGIWNSYVKRRLPGYEAAGIPAVLIEADMVDARFFDEEKITKQLDNFIQSF
ncbi:MAG: 2-hydroxyacyl-CoA dehydratase family protein [Candidatus Marinimicrobia bacterium]|jgi:benzoyl-CoA reductase/2-hydroxyglutaryl-CoA dehydratase subunit BcrC/BadD/HgdB|nr:2-hydroxyacyl-CoA dehydratase family protein [Candidatus Neomarinimicrobiota bacterium]|tara:strand:+ start:4326 stop:5537 length:1212 start_codon:yes stop_codon:yes gene_type:complete